MKKIGLIALLFITLFSLTACQEDTNTCIVPIETSFYETMFFEGSGYTPGYNYYLSGSLNELGEITSIRYDMVSIYGVSKRSNDYLMNNATLIIGGETGHQTIDLFIGGSTDNIPQVYNSIKGVIASDGSTTLKSLGILGAYPGAVVSYQEEIYGLLEEAFQITIDDTTTIADLLTPVGLFDTTNNVVKNGRKVVELTGVHGGKNYDHQLQALETYVVDNHLTLAQLYTLVSTNNQGFDNVDAVAGATILFDQKIVKITMEAAGITVNNDPVVIGNTVTNNETTITVRATGLHEMTVQIVFDNTKTITSVNVLTHTETEGYGKEVIEGTFIQTIIDNQTELSKVDAIAEATLTSNALIEAVKLAIETIS